MVMPYLNMYIAHLTGTSGQNGPQALRPSRPNMQAYVSPLTPVGLVLHAHRGILTHLYSFSEGSLGTAQA